MTLRYIIISSFKSSEDKLMNTNIKSFKRRDAKDLAGHYVIVYYRNGQIRYLADDDYTDRTWSTRIWHAKCYYDISAAEIKVTNLKYDMHPIYAEIKYVKNNMQLAPVRRDRNGRR